MNQLGFTNRLKKVLKQPRKKERLIAIDETKIKLKKLIFV